MPTPRLHAHPAGRQAAYRRRLAQAREKELAAKGMPPLPAVSTMPGHSRWEALIVQASLLLQTAHEEMQDYYDQRSEPWQTSERGEALLERLQALEELQSAVDELYG
jgi:hypothetical protein